MRACRKCGCTEKRACLEFDAEGYAHPCYWAIGNTCSACAFVEHKVPPSDAFEDELDTRIVVPLGKRKRGFLHVPALAGMVARPRR